MVPLFLLHIGPTMTKKDTTGANVQNLSRYHSSHELPRMNDKRPDRLKQ